MKAEQPIWRQGFKVPPSSFFLLPLLIIVSVVCTWSYYRWGYHQAIFAADRFTQTFEGFHRIEGDPPRVYRWTNGQAQLCMPAAGQERPALALRLDLLGQAEDLQIKEFVARVGSVELPLTLRQQDSRYHLLVPPDATYGPICVELLSSARMPEGDERLLGVGVRAMLLDRLPSLPPLLPPLDQLGVNAGLALGGYTLLRRWRLGRWFAGALVASITVGVSALLISGRIRFAPDLPLMTVQALAVLVGILTIDVLRADLTRRFPTFWAREWIIAGLTGALLLVGMLGFQTLAGYDPGSYPLMARMGPTFAPDVVWAIACFAVWLLLIVRWLRASQPPSPLLVVLVSWIVAFGIVVLLKAGLREADSLFQTFTWQPEDYIRDVRRVGADPLRFLGTYVEMMPRLARHNRTHPPGSTLFLWGLAQTIGPGPQVATWVVIALGALGVWPTYLLARWAAAALGPLHAGRLALLAAAVYGLLPAQLIFGATSMDAVFATVLAAAIYCLTRAILPDPVAPRRSWLYALLAGVWLAVGLLLTFTTFVLGVFAAVLAVWVLVRSSWRQSLPRLVTGGLIIGGTTLVLLVALWLGSGYNSWTAFREGSVNNTIDVEERTPPPGPATYLFFLGANLVAWGIYLGPWGANLLVRGGYAGLRGIPPSASRAIPSLAPPPTGGDLMTPLHRRGVWESHDRITAILAGMAALLLTLFVSGLFVREVERVLLFTHILVAFAVAYGIVRHSRSSERIAFALVVLIALFAQAFLMRVLLRIYW